MAGFEDLQEEMAEFSSQSESAFAALEKKQEELESGLSTQFLVGLTDEDAVPLETVDDNMYRAVEMQYDWDLINGRAAYVTAFDYDKYFDLGIN